MSRAEEIDAEAAVIRNVAAQHEQDAAIARATLAKEQLAEWRRQHEPTVHLGSTRFVAAPFAPTDRDHFANAATDEDLVVTGEQPRSYLLEFLGLPKGTEWTHALWHRARARARYMHADAMLAERSTCASKVGTNDARTLSAEWFDEPSSFFYRVHRGTLQWRFKDDPDRWQAPNETAECARNDRDALVRRLAVLAASESVDVVKLPKSEECIAFALAELERTGVTEIENAVRDAAWIAHAMCAKAVDPSLVFPVHVPSPGCTPKADAEKGGAS